MQGGRPIAYMSKALSERHKLMTVYEKEMLAIVLAIQKWRPYLLGRHFKAMTDHHSLKFLLQQKITTPNQQKWMSKLLGYDFEVLYKKGTENSAADALSRYPMLKAISTVKSEIWDVLQINWQLDPELI